MVVALTGIVALTSLIRIPGLYVGMPVGLIRLCYQNGHYACMRRPENNAIEIAMQEKNIAFEIFL